MPDILRKELTGVACNKGGADTRKWHWYALDEDPISEANCRFWQQQAGFDPEIYGCYQITIRRRKRGGYQATWTCAYETQKSKRNAASRSVALGMTGERKFLRKGNGHRGATVYIDHARRAKKFKNKKVKLVEEVKPKKKSIFDVFSNLWGK